VAKTNDTEPDPEAPETDYWRAVREAAEREDAAAMRLLRRRKKWRPKRRRWHDIIEEKRNDSK